jgi:Tfp pilus assembly protein PilX
MRRYRRLTRDESGIALITALLILMSLTAIGSFTINASMVNQDISANFKAAKQEFYLAEAGIQHTQWFLAQHMTNWSTYGYATAQTLISCTRLSLQQDSTPRIAGCGTTPVATDTVLGTYTVTIQSAGGVGGGSRKVISTGSTSSQGQAVLEALFANNPAYPCVVCSGSDFTLTGNSSTDSYDSTLGSYASQTHGNEGSIAANGNVTVTGSTVVHGNATAGGTVSGSGTITGTITNHADPQYFPPVPVCGPPYSSSAGMTLINATYDQNTGDLIGSGAAVVTLTAGPGTEKFCLHSIQLTSTSQLIVAAADGPVLLYLTADSDLGGHAIDNLTGKATDFRIYSSLSSATQGIVLAGGPTATAAVYAPNALVKFAGGSDFYGSMVGRSVTINGNTNFHYDKALTHLPNAGLGLVAWRQIF